MKTILVINSGSTSLKYKLFNAKNFRELKSGYIQDIGTSKVKNHEQALMIVLKEIDDLENIKAIGHRVVHGGEEFVQPTLITKSVLRRLAKYNKLAPLHNPANLMGIKACLKLLPKIPNLTVFDTSFHQTIPKKAYLYALPLKYYKKYRIRRYGFHGISHQYVAEEAAKKLKKPLDKLKIITCHLGGGCSITAINKGKSVDTSMGFTPAEGLVMMTRSGDIDPAIILFLERELRFTPSQIDKIINFQSGMLGLCGEENMLKVLNKVKRGNKLAKLAFDIFVYRIQKYIGAYYAALGGLDALVFTGAIGAGKPKTRNTICQGIKHIIRRVKVLAISTDEELMIARETLKVIKNL